MSIALIGSALGVVSLVLVVLAWRGRTAAAIALVVVRVAVGAHGRAGLHRGRRADGAAMVLAGMGITLTLVGVGLVLAGDPRPRPVGAAMTALDRVVTRTSRPRAAGRWTGSVRVGRRRRLFAGPLGIRGLQQRVRLGHPQRR